METLVIVIETKLYVSRDCVLRIGGRSQLQKSVEYILLLSTAIRIIVDINHINRLD